MEPKESTRTLPFTCPVCGKTTERSVDELKENALLICPFCHLKLTLHGHMWEEFREAIKGLGS